jgi:hypothetical protein
MARLSTIHSGSSMPLLPIALLLLRLLLLPKPA